jgi:uncharacterized protein involved in response to NO
MRLAATVLSAPHRAMFLGGTMQALMTMAFWSLQIGGDYAGLWAAPEWLLLAQVSSPIVHGVLLAGGVFPWFVFGFILTAGPRWQGAPSMRQADYLPPFILMAGGWMMFWPGLVLPRLAPAGVAVAACGMLLAARLVAGIARRPALGREHIVAVAMATGAGSVGLAAAAANLAGAGHAWGRLAIQLLVWGFLLPVFVTVAHRMLPFFTGAVLRGYRGTQPLWALRLLLAGSALHGTLAFLELPQWTWLGDLPAAIAATRLSWVWRDPRVLTQPMLAVLHVAFAWLGPAFALHAAQSILWQWTPALFGQAPLHALALGFFSSMLIGMVSRVTLGHSGQPVAADFVMLTAFSAMQLAALLRLAAESPASLGGIVLWLSTLAWLAGFGLWAARYGPFLWQARAHDGRG